MSVEPEAAQDSSANGLISRSHLGIEPFTLARPASLADAAAGVADGAWAHAGGIDVAQRLRHGESTESVVPLGGLEALTEISLRDGALFIGAAVTHAGIESNALVRAHRPDLAAAWRTIGNMRIRTAGTVGGNLMSLDAGYDAAPILAAAGAELVFLDPGGNEQRCSVADRAAGRLLVGCEVPLEGCVVYDRSLKPAASVAVGDRYAAIGCAYRNVEIIELEFDASSADGAEGAHGAGGRVDLDAVRAALDSLGAPLDDAYASSGYRRRVIEVLIERCVQVHAAGAPASPGDDAGQLSPGDDARRESAAPTGQPDQARTRRGDGYTVGNAGSVDLEMHLNGSPFEAAAPVSEMLVDTIRSRAGLGGTRVGCDQAVCGACTVLVDGLPTASCSTFAWQAAGREVHTIESANASSDTEPARSLRAVMRQVLQAFAETSAFQCGYCTPGLILTASSLLAHHPDPDRSTMVDWLDSNLCRCTGYLMVIEAVEAAGAALRDRTDAHPEPAT